MPSGCCAPNCNHSRSGRKTKCHMKRFPRDPARAALWEANVRRAGAGDWVRKPWNAICECHFDKKQFENRLDGLRKLRPNAVPLLFTRLRGAEGGKKIKLKAESQMVLSCCAVMCNHTSKTCKLKRFPTDSKRARVWQLNIGRPEWERNTLAYVCECHFDEEQYETNGLDGLKKLHSNAVPLIFPTHVLVVHDPSANKKWHCPKPRPPQDWIRSPENNKQLPEKVDVEEEDNQRKVKAVRQGGSKAVQNESLRYDTDHQYSKDAELDFLQMDDSSQMCANFCSPSELKEIENLARSSLNKDGLAESADSDFSGNEELYGEVDVLYDMDDSSNASGSPERNSDNEFCELETLAENTSVKTSLQQNAIQATYKTSPPHPNRVSKEMPVEIIATPDVWESLDMDSSVLTSPELLKDALSFLQFMLPQKWMAVSEDGGMHAFLLSRSRAKAIQRSVFLHLNGGEAEFYVHAVKLRKDHELYKSITSVGPLSRDSLGDFVDSIINSVELFASYKICCGVSHEQFLKEWRMYHDCIFDRNDFGENNYSETVRSTNCSLIVSKDKDVCKACSSLRKMYLSMSRSS